MADRGSSSSARIRTVTTWTNRRMKSRIQHVIKKKKKPGLWPKLAIRHGQVHVRFCERPVVQSRRPTQPGSTMTCLIVLRSMTSPSGHKAGPPNGVHRRVPRTVGHSYARHAPPPARPRTSHTLQITRAGSPLLRSISFACEHSHCRRVTRLVLASRHVGHAPRLTPNLCMLTILIIYSPHDLDNLSPFCSAVSSRGIDVPSASEQIGDTVRKRG